jgi:NAD(P)-dependent dehydrogenase (short-subunit alcohol dehydrogenase family)
MCDDGPIEQQSLDDLRQVIEVNLISVLDLCRVTAPLLQAAPAACVINVASMYGIVASRGPMAAYNATKGALVNLTRQLAAQWGERGVRVNALAPGYFPTELTGHLADPASPAPSASTPCSPAPPSWPRSTARCCSWPPPPPAT